MKVMKKMEKTFKALANHKRLEILKILMKNRRASVGEVSQKIHTSLKSTSKHLLVLYNGDFVEKERVFGLTLYRLKDTLGFYEKELVAMVRKHL